MTKYYSTLTIWNDLTAIMNEIRNPDLFKFKVKTYFLKEPRNLKRDIFE